MALGWCCLVVSQLQAHPTHGGGLGTHFLQPRQLSPCVCSKSGLLSNCVAVGTSMASGLPSCSEWQPPSPLLTEQEDTAFAAISNWMGQHPPQTHHEGVARQFLPETLSLWTHPIRVFCHSMLIWPFRYSFVQKMTISHIHPIHYSSSLFCI